MGGYFSILGIEMGRNGSHEGYFGIDMGAYLLNTQIINIILIQSTVPFRKNEYKWVTFL